MMIKSLLFSGLPCVTRVQGHSMMPTLQDKQYCLYNPFCRKYKHGDIVTVDVNGKALVKRIIAVGGDRITIAQSGSVAVNGIWLDEPYIAKQSKNGKSVDEVVPDGYVWLMGDNRGASTDSRSFGFVPNWCIIGKVIKRK